MSFLTSILFRKEISRPVFILGCGRSGTTILGKTLAEHRDITYLNERRDLWSEAYPQTNIWTGDVSTRGRMCLAGEDAERSRSKKLRRLFHRESLKTSRPVLVEKLPINNFRLEFINEIFPDARFVHIYRNGLEVARSIQTLSDQGHWYKFNHYKWDQLKQLAQKDAVTSDIPEMCNSYFRQGLFE